MIDLFASPQNHKLPLWFGRVPFPSATATDALSQCWTGWYVYGFPPFNLIRRMLIKLRDDQVEEAIVIVPYWPRRPWFPLLMNMACEEPVRLPPRLDLLSQELTERGTLYHPEIRRLHLTAWKLNARPGTRPAFPTRSSRRRSLPNVHLPERSMTPDGLLSVPGALNGTSSQCQPL
jgi:hypothetical protein